MHLEGDEEAAEKVDLAEGEQPLTPSKPHESKPSAQGAEWPSNPARTSSTTTVSTTDLPASAAQATKGDDRVSPFAAQASGITTQAEVSDREIPAEALVAERQDSMKRGKSSKMTRTGSYNGTAAKRVVEVLSVPVEAARVRILSRLTSKQLRKVTVG